MSILSKEDILKAVESKELFIEPFNPEKTEPASYDLSVGAILAAGEGLLKLNKDEDYTLQPNDWALLRSDETIKIPLNLCATYGISFSTAKRGLIHFGGPQFDPGYNGKLFTAIYNPTLEPITIRMGQNLFTMIFHHLSSETTVAYSGVMQGKLDFAPEDVERMVRMKSKNLSDVIDRVDNLDKSFISLDENFKLLTSNVESLAKDVHKITTEFSNYKPILKKFDWVLNTILGIAGAVTVGTLVFLIQKLIDTIV